MEAVGILFTAISFAVRGATRKSFPFGVKKTGGTIMKRKDSFMLGSFNICSAHFQEKSGTRTRICA